MITFFGIAGLVVNAIEHELFYKGGDEFDISTVRS